MEYIFVSPSSILVMDVIQAYTPCGMPWEVRRSPRKAPIVHLASYNEESKTPTTRKQNRLQQSVVEIRKERDHLPEVEYHCNSSEVDFF